MYTRSVSEKDFIQFGEGDKIEFTLYSNIDPRPRCIGVIDHVYGPTFIEMMNHLYQMDVKVIDVLNNPSAKERLVGKMVRISNDFDVKPIK